MTYPRWEDVSFKIKHDVSGDIYRFFAARSISAYDLLKKIATLFKLDAGEFTVCYFDDEKSWVVLESEDDLHCALNRRQKRDGPGVDYGPKPVYFLRLLVKPRKVKSHVKTGRINVPSSKRYLVISNRQQQVVTTPSETEVEPAFVDSPYYFSSIDKNNPDFEDYLWK